jgi:hypothetical protein
MVGYQFSALTEFGECGAALPLIDNARRISVVGWHYLQHRGTFAHARCSAALAIGETAGVFA